MKITALAYDGCLGAELFGFTDLLRLANRVAIHRDANRPPPFEVSIACVADRTVTLAGGLKVTGQPPGKNADLLVVPGFDFERADQLDKAFARLRNAIECVRSSHARGITIASICVGSFVLAEAGVLNGRRATTAWMFADELARRFPLITVLPNEIVVEDGVTTTGAFSAATDLALRLIRRVTNASTARIVTKMSLNEGRQRSQAEYVDLSFGQSSKGKLSDDVNRWLSRRVSHPYKLSKLAADFHVSTRTLLRKYRAEAGQTPLQFLQRIRIEQAKQLLESGRHSIDQISARVGYSDLSTFRRLFVRLTTLTPTAYRRRFAGK
jgi:transcriptional regulator GlxA family with amidase domain